MCGWADTFLIVAWLVRETPDLAADTVKGNLLPCGLDYIDCPFEEWICLSDFQPPMSNLLSLYHFFIHRL